MPQRARPASNSRGQPGDDFRKINRITLTVQRRLHDSGILTYQDLAERTPRQLADVAKAPYTAERIAKEDWVGQAQRLASPSLESSDLGQGQGHASFTLELLLGSDNSVRHTRVLHVETSKSDKWAGWDLDRLLTFLSEGGASFPPAPEPAAATDVQAPPAPAPAEPPATAPEEAPAAVPSRATRQLPPTTRSTTLPPSFLRVEELIPIRGGQRIQEIRPDEATSVRLRLSTSPTDQPDAGTFDLVVEFAARPWDGDERVLLGTERRTLRAGSALSVDLTGGPSLPSGLYRLLVAISVHAAGHAAEATPLYTERAAGDVILVGDPSNQGAPPVALSSSNG
jgi:hypothetical protein